MVALRTRRRALLRPVLVLSLLFFLTLLAPTKSTLFPYTTLFRSKYYSPRQKEVKIVARPRIAVFEKPNLKAVRLLLDRKSTRLNSSHTVISYAVFCLKKKNASIDHGEGKESHVHV